MNPRELAIGLPFPIKSDSVAGPHVNYEDPSFEQKSLNGIYFITNDEQNGRVLFEKLDSIRISRGEYLPYERADESQYHWISEIENSKWLQERYRYEKKYYGQSYEFNGNVDEMLSDFRHFLFQFHDQFVEVISKGFWIEKDVDELYGKPLKEGHPFLPIVSDNVHKIEYAGMICFVRINQNAIEKLSLDALYCSQTLMEFRLDENDNSSPENTLSLTYRNKKLISVLQGYFGKQVVEFDGVVGLDAVSSYIKNYMKEVIERRKNMRN
jgi:hypothetical protein